MSDEQKWGLLAMICESPGWAPEHAAYESPLSELRGEGWIIDRLDGFEAAPMALESYPHFNQPERRHLAPPSPKPESGSIPFDHVVALLWRLLNDRPVAFLGELCEVRLPAGARGFEVDIARQLAERLR